jgi:V8-like Glu-specific endopeptidase
VVVVANPCFHVIMRAYFPFVGQVRGQFDDGMSLCTATLLSCGAAITAGHCLWRPNVTAPSADVYLTSQISGSAGATLFISSEFVFHLSSGVRADVRVRLHSSPAIS